MASSIFLQFSLPNSVSWYYFSSVLTVALFFQFSRIFCVRNLDLLMLFVFAPGFLLLQEGVQSFDDPAAARRLKYVGYGWLLSASLYWFVRAQLDLMTFRRPLVSPNLTVPGLVFLAAVLLVTLGAVAYGRPADPWQPVGNPPAAVTGVQPAVRSGGSLRPSITGFRNPESCRPRPGAGTRGRPAAVRCVGVPPAARSAGESKGEGERASGRWVCSCPAPRRALPALPAGGQRDERRAYGPAAGGR